MALNLIGSTSCVLVIAGSSNTFRSILEYYLVKVYDLCGGVDPTFSVLCTLFPTN